MGSVKAMKTISILSQKGGAGKTTIAINLAGAAEAEGLRTVIIDLDPQASAKAWHDHRQQESPVVISAQAASLHEVLATAADHGAALCIIDTAPHSETTALAAAKAADLILIPCRASYIDLKAISTSVDLVQLAKRPAMFVLSCVRPGDKSLPDQAEEGLAIYRIPVATVRITLRSAFVHSLTAGQTVNEYDPDGAAAREIRALFKLSCKQDYKITMHQDHGETSTYEKTITGRGSATARPHRDNAAN
jgi:chromosome partitioning protein